MVNIGTKMEGGGGERKKARFWLILHINNGQDFMDVQYLSLSPDTGSGSSSRHEGKNSARECGVISPPAVIRERYFPSSSKKVGQFPCSHGQIKIKTGDKCCILCLGSIVVHSIIYT